MPITKDSGGITITGDSIAIARILALKGALSLEVKGLTRRGTSAYAIVKREFGFKGSRKSVLAQLEQYIETTVRSQETE